tara:strand:- start:184 stop:486 length:303 start_codon:yes stop_codon:yes gene_type:complete
MENLKKKYEKNQLLKNIEKLLFITNLTCNLFGNKELENLEFINGPCYKEKIYIYLDKHFNCCNLFPTSIYFRIIDSLSIYYKNNPNSIIINKYILDVNNL